jgi:hypothetical protein
VHDALDAAVAAACGWSDYTPAMPDDEILHRLPGLNLLRAAARDPAVRDTQPIAQAGVWCYHEPYW